MQLNEVTDYSSFFIFFGKTVATVDRSNSLAAIDGFTKLSERFSDSLLSVHHGILKVLFWIVSVLSKTEKNIQVTVHEK